jgi:hypothetical protein
MIHVRRERGVSNSLGDCDSAAVCILESPECDVR